ncbi:MAG: hypothetical protein ABIT83_16500 [Massilia sp.]
MTDFKQLRWQAEVLAQRHGLWLLPALALLVCAMAAWAWWVPAQESALRSALSAQAPRETPAPTLAAPAPRAPLPRSAQADHGLQRLFALAGEHGVRISQADYRRQETGRVGRWQVQLPATGNYVQLRRFLRAAQAIPGVSVDELGMHKGAPGGRIEARLLFSVWYAPDVPAAEGGRR